MAENDSDVVVVGGGPAGAIISYVVAKAGFKVILLDKKRREKIGDKTCGDALDYATAELLHSRLGIPLPHGDEVSDEIKVMSIAAGDIDTKIRLTAPGFVTDRLIYGQRLLGQSEKVGVEIRPMTAVRGVLTNADFVDGVSYIDKSTGKKGELRSKFVVDASGAFASIRRVLPDEIRGKFITKELQDDMVWPTYREIVAFDSFEHRWMNEIILWYPHDIPIPGYFWVFSKGSKGLNLGIGWIKSEENMPSLKEEYRRFVDKISIPEYEVQKAGGGQIPMRIPFDTNVFNGGLIVGDAACMVHPTTAEGHGPALESAMYGGEAIISALKANKRDKQALWSYNEQIMRHIGPKHANAYLMRIFLESIGSRGLSEMITKQFITDEEMDRIVRGEELKLGIFTKLIKALKLFPDFKLLKAVSMFQKRIAEVNKCYRDYPGTERELENWVKQRNSILEYNF